MKCNKKKSVNYTQCSSLTELEIASMLDRCRDDAMRNRYTSVVFMESMNLDLDPEHLSDLPNHNRWSTIE